MESNQIELQRCLYCVMIFGNLDVPRYLFKFQFPSASSRGTSLSHLPLLLYLPSRPAVAGRLPVSLSLAVSLTNLKLLYRFPQCPRADFLVSALPDRSLTN